MGTLMRSGSSLQTPCSIDVVLQVQNLRGLDQLFCTTTRKRSEQNNQCTQLSKYLSLFKIYKTGCHTCEVVSWAFLHSFHFIPIHQKDIYFTEFQDCSSQDSHQK